MTRNKRIPVALTIAGSDSGGGAGIQADLKTFAALGVHGTSALTCVTAQNPKRVLGIEACSQSIVRAQLEAIGSELRPAAVKTGMLYTAETVRTVATWVGSMKDLQLVVDPVMVSSSAASLLKRAALHALKSELLPKAALVTPNLDETGVLLGNRTLRSVEDMRYAARRIQAEFGCAALIKGGHLRGHHEALDIFYDGKTELLLRAPFVRGVSTHGTGCTYSAAITAFLALDYPLARSVELGKRYITQAICGSDRIPGGHTLRHAPLFA